jgi:hypothetical protein
MPRAGRLHKPGWTLADAPVDGIADADLDRR